MKKCILCGKTHEGRCKLEGADAEMWAHRFPIEKIEETALKQDEEIHRAKKRGRPGKNGK